MNNQERKLFNIATKIEKLLYEHCDIIFFDKKIGNNSLIINSGRKILDWNFIEPFTDLMKKDDISFSISQSIEDECLQINIAI